VSVADERLPHPQWMTRPPFSLALTLFTRADVRATPDQLAAFRRFAQAGDPLADAVVAMMRELPPGQGRRLFEQAVSQGIGSVASPPPALAAFFASVDAVPYWLDRDQLDRGSRVIGRTGLLGMVMVMPMMGLYGGYLASRANKTLLRTGDLDGMAPRRLAETAGWWVDVTTPGGLDRFGAGFTGVLRVRLMHAQVRAAMTGRADWDYEAWDHPVNQLQTTGTLLLFSLVMLLGSRLLGLRFSRRDRAAALHLWRYVGHLMGVHPDLLPVTEADAWRLFWLEGATEFRPDEDSRRLGQALLAASPTLLLPPRWKDSPRAGRMLTGYQAAFARLVLGKRNADFLGTPDSKLYQAAVVATGAAVLAAETARPLIPGATRLSERAGQRQRTKMIRRLVREQHGDSTYTRHDTLAQGRAGGPGQERGRRVTLGSSGAGMGGSGSSTGRPNSAVRPGAAGTPGSPEAAAISACQAER
jgi:ER-bound oxygenase mpaB/B'/Rubber oxygenase, catalytic domain